MAGDDENEEDLRYHGDLQQKDLSVAASPDSKKSDGKDVVSGEGEAEGQGERLRGSDGEKEDEVVKEDEEEDEDDEDEDDEDEEPKLKYASLTKGQAAIYRNKDATSAFLVGGDKMVRILQPIKLST